MTIAFTRTDPAEMFAVHMPDKLQAIMVHIEAEGRDVDPPERVVAKSDDPGHEVRSFTRAGSALACGHLGHRSVDGRLIPRLAFASAQT